MPIGDSTQLLGEEATRDLLVAMLQQAEEDKKLLLEVLREFLTKDPGWEGHFVRCGGGHGDADEPLATQRCSKAQAAIEKAEGS